MARKSQKTALDIRIRLMRDVAARKITAMEYAKELGDVEDKLKALEKENADLLEKLGAKLRCRIPSDEITPEIVAEVKTEYDNFLSSHNKRKMALLHKKEECKEMERAFSSKAREKFNLLLDEIRGWQFGRGDVIISHNEIYRVFGIIKESGETYHCSGYFFHRENYVSDDDVKKIAEACRNNQQPLIHITKIELMPLNQEEVDAICKDNADYNLIKKLIPKEMIPWKPSFVYVLKADFEKEIYITPINENEVAVLRVDILDFPNRKVKIIGKMRRDEENMTKIFYASANESLAEIIKKVNSKEGRIAMKSLREYCDRKHPGVIITV